MTCNRIGGCLKERTKGWAHPQKCICEIHAELDAHANVISNQKGKQKHMGDITTLNQHR